MFKVFLKVSYIKPTQYVQKNTSRKKKQFSVDMFVENQHKRTFLENLIRNYHDRKKINDIHNYTNSKKIPWVPNTGPFIRKKFKNIHKYITFISSKNLKSIL